MWYLVTTVAVPYVLFEGVYALFRHAVGGVDFERLWANPHWPMWYLSALFFWRLMTPIFKRMPGKVVVAVAISLLAGLYANDILDNARIFGLLPFFVLGLKMHEGHWNLLRTRRARWYGIAALLGLLFVLARFSGQLVRDRVALLPLPLRRARPRQPARHRDPDVAAARRAWSARSRSSPLVPADADLVHAPWAARPSWSTCSTASSCSARSSPGSSAGRRTTGRSSFVAGDRRRDRRWRCSWRWQPVSSRLNVFVDPVGHVHPASGARRRVVERVEVGAPARGDRVERHLVEQRATAARWGA